MPAPTPEEQLAAALAAGVPTDDAFVKLVLAVVWSQVPKIAEVIAEDAAPSSSGVAGALVVGLGGIADPDLKARAERHADEGAEIARLMFAQAPGA